MPTEYRGTPVAPVIRGSTVPSTSPSTPANTEVGDLILAVGTSVGSVSNGWTAYPKATSGGSTISIAFKVATAAGAEIQAPWSSATLIGLVVFKRGTYDANIADHRGPWAVNTSDPPNPAAITTSVENSMVFVVGWWDVASGSTTANASITPPTGYTEVWEISGANEWELSCAYKVVATPGAEDPGVFADNITPVQTAAVTFEIRPSGMSDLDIPNGTDARTEANIAPPFRQCTANERYVIDRLPEFKIYQNSGAPLLAWLDNTTYLSASSSVLVDFDNCVVGDKILIDLSMTYELAGTWSAGYSSRQWSIKLRAQDDLTGTPAELFPDGGHFFGVTLAIPYPLNKRLHMRMIGVHEVRVKGKTRIDLKGIIGDGTGNAVNIYSLALSATKFPTAYSVNAPVLTSVNIDLADTAGGDERIVYGSALGGSTITVGGTSATVIETSRNFVRFLMPAKAAGSHNIQATTTTGSSNTIAIEAWNPGTDAVAEGIVAFGEAPDYESTGVGLNFLNNGVWHMRLGTNWTKTSDGTHSAPNVAPGGTPGFGYAAWGSGLVMYLEGPHIDALFDLAGASAGSCGFIVNSWHEGSGAPGPGDVHIFADGSGNGKYDLHWYGAGAKFRMHISTNAGPAYATAITPNFLTGNHAVLARFADGAGNTGTLQIQVDGCNDSGVAGFASSATAFSTLDACADTAVLGTNTSRTVKPDGSMRAFFFASKKVSDTYAAKWLKWSRGRHGVV